MTTQNQFGRVFVIRLHQPGLPKSWATLSDSAEQIREQFHQGFPDVIEEPEIVPGDWDAVAEIAERGIGPIVDTVEWEPSPRMPEGYVRIKRRKTLAEVAQELRSYLGEEHETSVEFPISPYVGYHGEDAWPKGRVVVFSIRGGSEGDWVHVEVQGSDNGSRLVLLSKTFSGREAAWRDARRIADLLGA